MANFVLGKDCILKHGAAGSTAATLVPTVRDLTVNMENDEADVSSRAGAGFKETALPLIGLSIDFEMLFDATEAICKGFITAYLARTKKAFLVTDASGDGWDADFVITNFTYGQPLNGAVVAKFTIKPTPSTRAPAWLDAA